MGRLGGFVSKSLFGGGDGGVSNSTVGLFVAGDSSDFGSGAVAFFNLAGLSSFAVGGASSRGLGAFSSLIDFFFLGELGGLLFLDLDDTVELREELCVGRCDE